MAQCRVAFKKIINIWFARTNERNHSRIHTHILAERARKKCQVRRLALTERACSLRTRGKKESEKKKEVETFHHTAVAEFLKYITASRRGKINQRYNAAE